MSAGALGVGGAAAALALAGGAGTAVGQPRSTPAAHAAAKNKVKAIFAGSLVDIMEKALGPAFTKATGYPFEGYGGGSTEDAAQIKGGVRTGDVFVSASASADKELEGASNGNWVSWYTTFQASELVMGYDAKSTAGKELKAGKPWYEVLSKHASLIGRTDPKTDPKGKLTVEAVDTAAKKLHDPSLTKSLKSMPEFEETAMLARLQSGQLEAAFFYVVEAKESHVPTVSIKPVYKYADYTLTILGRAENLAGAEALVSYLLSPQRKAVMERYGLVRQTPRFSGQATAVPKGLRKLVGAG
jgi:molybdate/tungstate transport system substrate-binding protein